MPLPPYYLTRPEFELTLTIRDEFEDLFAQAVQDGASVFVRYSCATPKWQFLSYLGDNKNLLFHGTGDSGIAEFEPRQSDDVQDFGNQKAVYAASDPLWAMYFAIVDRDRYRMSLSNACFRLIEADGTSAPYYYFSINSDALVRQPWRPGTIYVLPRDGFEQQKSSKSDREPAQWRGFTSVKPLAKISVEPADFPFLDQIRGHDVKDITRRARENPDGFPWLDEYPNNPMSTPPGPRLTL